MKRRILFTISLVLVIMLISTSGLAFTIVPVSKVSLNEREITLGVGQTAEIKAAISPSNATNKTVKWSTSDKKVATIDSKGKIKALKTGQTYITAKSSNGKVSEKCIVTVVNKKITEISWLGINEPGLPISKGTYVQKLIEKKFDVLIKPVEIDMQAAGAVQLYFSSGNKPDVFITLASLLTSGQFTGAFREIPQSMINEKLAAVIKIQKELGDENYQLAWDMMKVKGKIMGIPAVQTWAAYTYIMGVRSDWLKNVGISAVPRTIDEFENIIKKFTLQDPDGNQKNDTYGLASHQWYFYGVWPYVWGAYGIDPWAFGLKNEKVYPYATSDQFKDALKRIRGWYKAGYIDPDLVQDRNKYWDNIANSKLGVWCLDPFHATMETGPLARLRKATPGADFKFFAAFAGPGGSGASKGLRGYGSYALFVGANADDEKLGKILDIVNAMNADKNLYTAVRYGKEGVSYTVKDGIISAKTITPQKAMGEIGSGGSASTGYFFSTNEGRDSIIDRMTPEFQQIFNIGYSNKKVAEMNFGLMGFKNASNYDEIQYSTLVPIVTEFMFKAIKGENDIDAAWDEYVKRYMSSGGKILVNEFQEMVNNK